MQRSKTAFYVTVIVILALGIFSAGCTSNTSTSPVTPTVTPAPPLTPDQTVLPTTNPEATTTAIMAAASTTIPASAATTQAQYKTYTNSQYGISLLYPKGWEVEESGKLAMRDYGRETTNVVNFFSPGKNTYVTFSVDVDPTTTTDLEKYYNTAVLALQAYYPHWEMTKHSASMKVSDSNAYRIDYRVTHTDTNKLDYGVQVYTIVKGTPYIFTYQGNDLLPEDEVFSANLDEAQDMIKSVKIAAVTNSTKSR